MFASLAQRPSYKWWVFWTIAIGTFMSVVDHGSVLVALPEIEAHFQSDLPTVQWVVVGYALAISVLLLPMGRLGDILSRKNVYVAGFVIFVASAALAGFSPNLAMLITAKVLQGVGSALIQGNGMAMIIATFPGNERGKVLGTHLSVVGVGSIVGPALGGFLVDGLGWRWVFFINVPIGVVTIAASAMLLGHGRSAETQGVVRPRFDWPGAALSGGALLLFLLVVGNGDRIGWTTAPLLTGALGALVMLVAFIWWELRVPSPMLELRLFRRRLLAFGIAAGWLSFLGGNAARFMMPFYLQRILGYSPKEVGLFMIPAALCLTVLGPISGTLSDRFGWRKFTMGGLALSAASCFILATTLTDHSPVLLIISMLVLQSAGTGLFNSPNNNSILSAVERSRYGVVSSLTQLVRNSANVTSVALTTTVVVVTMGSMGVEPSLDAVSPAVAGAFVAGLRRAFLLLGVLLTVGIALSYFKGNGVRETATPASPVAEKTGVR
ncbi:MAG: DHA2 family efflux MFS transporter permease subunit [Dehalococcoidia bacterium]|nr:DHA2 family efflux MFS transporter permease subunit [Dehalococcoidia bacterium]MSQ17095.1 DHA2 family efflux MFS transporter permease subunit [Dehalococcoidia bacterium]